MLPGSEFSEPVQTQTVGYPVLSGTRENTRVNTVIQKRIVNRYFLFLFLKWTYFNYSSILQKRYAKTCSVPKLMKSLPKKITSRELPSQKLIASANAGYSYNTSLQKGAHQKVCKLFWTTLPEADWHTILYKPTLKGLLVHALIKSKDFRRKYVEICRNIKRFDKKKLAMKTVLANAKRVGIHLAGVLKEWVTHSNAGVDHGCALVVACMQKGKHILEAVRTLQWVGSECTVILKLYKAKDTKGNLPL